MMSQDLEADGGANKPPQSDWWVIRYSSWLATVGAVILGFLGVVGAVFNTVTLSLQSALASILQGLAAGVILSIEGSSLIPFFKPVGLLFENKPLYYRAILYGLLTIIPMFFDPSGVSAYLGFLVSAAITAIYAVIIIGRKGSLDDMKVAASQEQYPSVIPGIGVK